MTNMLDSTKKQLKSFGIFLGVTAAFMAILIGMMRVSEKSWNNGLKKATSAVLEEYEPGKWRIGDSVPITNPFALNAACFRITSKAGSGAAYAVMLRVETFYGPFPGVFIYDPNAGTTFVGFATIHGHVAELLRDQKSDARILYWKQKIPQIIGKSE